MKVTEDSQLDTSVGFLKVRTIADTDPSSGEQPEFFVEVTTPDGVIHRIDVGVMARDWARNLPR